MRESERKQGRSAAGSGCEGPEEGINLQVTGQRARCHEELFLGPAERLSAPSIRAAEEGKTTPPPTRRAAFTSALCLLFYTLLTFYSFSSFLPFDGLLCVRAVGKFSVMMRSSSTGNSPHRYHHSDAHPHPSQRQFTLFPCHESPRVPVPLPEPLQGPAWALTRTCCSQLSRNQEEMLSRKCPKLREAEEHVRSFHVFHVPRRNSLMFLQYVVKYLQKYSYTVDERLMEQKHSSRGLRICLLLLFIRFIQCC